MVLKLKHKTATLAVIPALLKLKKTGCCTFVKDKDSSVIYGMPKAAAELNAACKALSPREMAA